MSDKTLQDAFKDELRDTYDAERQLVKALPKMVKAATAPQLKKALETHLEETRGQVKMLEKVFESLGEKVRGKHCDGMEGILEEGKSVMEEDFDDATMDACLIASGQRAEHYEIAAYGTLVAWAQALGHTKEAEMFQTILDQESAADKKLTALAEGGINRSASAGGGDEDKDKAADSSRARKTPVKQPRKAAKSTARTPTGRKTTARK